MRIDAGSYPSMKIDEHVSDPNFVNAHAILVDAPQQRVWDVARSFLDNINPGLLGKLGLAAASIVRMGPATVSVSLVDEPNELILTGRHRFADFATNLRLEPEGDKTRLYNVTRARFRTTPIGRVYLAGVHLFHDAYIDRALKRIKALAERTT